MMYGRLMRLAVKAMEDNTFKLSESKLGTKEYWDDFYRLEESNFSTNPEDTGECWFDESNAEEKMVEFLVEHFDEIPSIHKDSKIIDLGTGNGHLLFELYKHEDELFRDSRLIGIDYSEASVSFAQKIAKNEKIDHKIMFQQVDFLTNHQQFLDDPLFQNVDIFLDKGTLDAIALSLEKYPYEGQQYLGYELYPRIVSKLMKKGTLLLITSCNFSEEELLKVVLENSTGLQLCNKIKYPNFQFGGVKGSTICSLAFIKE